jgi:hypothetical protein
MVGSGWQMESREGAAATAAARLGAASPAHSSRAPNPPPRPPTIAPMTPISAPVAPAVATSGPNSRLVAAAVRPERR